MKIVFQKTTILLLLAAGFVFSANAQQVKATASLDSARILIGDQVKLILQLDKPKDMRVNFPVIGDSIAGKIEVISKTGTDTVKNGDIEKIISTYLITCFDSGSYQIPIYWFSFEKNGISDSIASNSLLLNVATLAIDTTKGPADIKMPYDAPLTLKEVTPYILGIILVAAILFFILYSIKRRKQNLPVFSKPAKPKEPAHVVALRELDRIKNEKLWQKDKIKQFYSEVTEVLRVYIEERFEIAAMEQTSDETLSAFKFRRDLLSEKTFSNLSHILTTADMVKFAKYIPLPDDNNLTLVNAYFFVNETKKEEAKTLEKPVDDREGEEVTVK